jgi:tRNA threonylcarbamoyladenosine biosynthesis protein TsaB
MKVLALDTATMACSAAVLADGVARARRFEAMARGQSEKLVPMAAQVLAEAGLTVAELDLLAVTVGPGAFTGLRIGLAAARALALASGLKLAGVTTTEAVAHNVPECERQGRTVLVVLDSKREELWVQAFGADLAPLGDIRAALPEQAAALVNGPVVLAGDAAGLVAPLLPGATLSTALGWPDAAVVGRLAAERFRAGTALPAEPLYLREADVTVQAPSS